MADYQNDEQRHRRERTQGKHTQGHTHGAVDPSIITSQRGIWAIKWSFIGLFATAVLQIVVVRFSGSVALLADTIHNFGDAATAIPLWVAFKLARLRPTKRFTYGYGRVEDLAGIAIVFTILLSAAVAGYESIDRFYHPQAIRHLWAVMLAALIGFIGNEIVAQFRIKTGEEIGSAALVADGHHARVDGMTSLAVLFGAAGVWMGYPLADPVIALIISAAILRIVWESGKSVFIRILDGVDPEVIDEVRYAVNHTPGVTEISEVRIRWLGHQLHAELNISVSPQLTVEEGHEIAKEVHRRLLHQLRYFSNATVHVDPAGASGEAYHRFASHERDDGGGSIHLTK
jgi:cation diffusion facilitator family transporter